MENELFADLVQSLGEAVEYAKGDKKKGRLMTVTVPDEEVEMDQMIFQQIC